MKIDVLMADNRGLSADKNEYYNWTAAANKLASQTFGYNFYFYKTYSNEKNIDTSLICKDPNSGLPRHVAWAKILVSYYHLKSKECNYLIYIDSDAFLLNKINLIDYLNQNKVSEDVFFCNNLPWETEANPCSGFFVMKNSKHTLQFLEEWYKQNDSEHNLKHSWEQNILQKIYTKYNIFVENKETVHFVNKNTNNSLYSNLVHHLTRFSFNNKNEHLDYIKYYISKYYNLEKIKQLFNSNEKQCLDFDVDPFSTLDPW